MRALRSFVEHLIPALRRERVSSDDVAPLLTAENYRQGLLVDDGAMAGVSADQDSYFAFVIALETGKYLGCHRFSRLDDALEAINRIPRAWRFESFGSQCGGGECGSGACDPSACGIAGACCD